MSRNPESTRAKKSGDGLTFADLKIGERFAFKNKSTVACGKYNGDFTKVTDGSFRGQCFTGYPDSSVEVVPI